MTNLSIILPVYNESSRVLSGLEQAVFLATISGMSTEILLVDDGSSDDTVEQARQSNIDGLRIISCEHSGKGAAVREGMIRAEGELRMFSDIDWSVRPKEVHRLLRSFQGEDILIASREGQGARRLGEPFWRHLLGRAFNIWVQTTFISGHADTQCGCKIFRAQCAQQIFSELEECGWAFDIEALALAHRRGMTVRECPVTWVHDPHSTIEVFEDGLKMLIAVHRIKQRFRHSTF